MNKEDIYIRLLEEYISYGYMEIDAANWVAKVSSEEMEILMKEWASIPGYQKTTMLIGPLGMQIFVKKIS